MWPINIILRGKWQKLDSSWRGNFESGENTSYLKAESGKEGPKVKLQARPAQVRIIHDIINYPFLIFISHFQMF